MWKSQSQVNLIKNSNLFSDFLSPHLINKTEHLAKNMSKRLRYMCVSQR